MRPLERRSRQAFLDTPLGDLDGHWLEIHCGCDAVVFYPCKLLAKEGRGSTRVGDLLPRLRCKHCKARPARVLMTNNPARGPQYGDAWAVALDDE
jgi:hypothetical protein